MQTPKSEMSAEEKIDHVDGIRVIYPKFAEMLDLIEKVHTEGLRSKSPLSMLIYGPSGSGKSTIKEAYLAHNQQTKLYRTSWGKTASSSILTVNIPSPASYTAVTENLLKQLGDRYFSKGSPSQKVDRLGELIKRNNIQLIMADEFQHFVEQQRYDGAYTVSNWFKSVLDTIKIPVIVFGLDLSMEVLKVNKQLSRRMPFQEFLEPFKRNSCYLDFLEDLEEQLSHVFEKQSHLTDPDISDAMFYATDGLIDSIMMIIRRAARLTIARNGDRIEKVDLADAFQMYGHLHQEGKGKDVNPFLIDNFSM